MRSIRPILNCCCRFSLRRLSGLRVWLWLLTLSPWITSGAAFLNLDFEDGPIYDGGPILHPTQYADVMPGWTVNAAAAGQTNAFCNNFLLDQPSVALMTTNTVFGPDYVIAGDRSAYLQSASWSLSDPAGTAINVSISQVGTVPSDALSLIFDARNQWYGPLGEGFPVPPGPFEVTLNGAILPLIELASDGGANVIYGADVSSWAGQEAELSIGVLASPAWGGSPWEGWAVVDSIHFSPNAIPEPSTIVLSGLGLLSLFWWHWRRQH